MSNPENSLILPLLTEVEDPDEHKRQTAEAIDRVRQMMKQEGIIGYGSTGNLLETAERIPISELWWYDKLYSLAPDKEIIALRDSILETQKQEGGNSTGIKIPLIVVACKDPRNITGAKNKKYFVIDGKRRIRALIKGGDGCRYAKCIIHQYEGLHYHLLESLTINSARHELTMLELGENIQLLKYVLDQEFTALGLPESEKPNTHDQFYSRLLAKDQTYINRSRRIANLPIEVKGLIRDNLIYDYQVIELLSLSSFDILEQAFYLAEQNKTGKVSRDTVRKIREKTKNRETEQPDLYFPQIQSTFTRSGFLTYHIPDPSTVSPPTLVGAMANDLHKMLGLLIETQIAQKDKPDPELVQLYKALNKPKIAQFVEKVRNLFDSVVGEEAISLSHSDDNVSFVEGTLEHNPDDDDIDVDIDH